MNFDKDVIQYLANLTVVKAHVTSFTQSPSRNMSKEDIKTLYSVASKLDNEFISVLLNQASGTTPYKVFQRDADTGIATKPNAIVNKDGSVVIGPQEEEVVIPAAKPELLPVKNINGVLVVDPDAEEPEEEEKPMSIEEMKAIKEKAKRTSGKTPAVKRAKDDK